MTAGEINSKKKKKTRIDQQRHYYGAWQSVDQLGSVCTRTEQNLSENYSNPPPE